VDREEDFAIVGRLAARLGHGVVPLNLRAVDVMVAVVWSDGVAEGM
jgi:hypothetical protein